MIQGHLCFSYATLVEVSCRGATAAATLVEVSCRGATAAAVTRQGPDSPGEPGQTPCIAMITGKQWLVAASLCVYISITTGLNFQKR